MKAGPDACRRVLLLAAWSWLALLPAPACSETTNLVGNGVMAPADAGASSDPDAAVSVSDASVMIPVRDDAGVIRCGKHTCACSNALDDDGDDLLDTDDNECIGPADDDELSFATGTERDAERACQDCFFDGNSGAGDGCRRASSCATTGDARSGTGACKSCDVTSQCVESCRPLTPNGCDCFGCCEVHLDGGQVVDVMLRAGCSMATLDDPDLCQRCTKAPECENPCEACELCLGKGPLDLPSQCAGSSPACGDGEPSCDPERPCPPELYCQWGCCLPILL